MRVSENVNASGGVGDENREEDGRWLYYKGDFGRLDPRGVFCQYDKVRFKGVFFSFLFWFVAVRFCLFVYKI